MFHNWKMVFDLTSLHVDDLLNLEYTCPNVFKEFCNGNFVISRTENSFSSIAIDQAHEQHNAVLKEVGSAVGLLSQYMDAALWRWEIADLEVVALLNEYEKCLGPKILVNITKTILHFRK